MFQGPSGRWVNEMSLTTLGKECPISEKNSELYNSGDDADKLFVTGTKGKSGSKRRLNYVSNILVVKDPANPENNGKVFLYRYGITIFEMIESAMNPQFDDIDPIDPFNPFEGADFHLRVRRESGFPKYDKSAFGEPKPIADSDKEIVDICKQSHSLAEIVSADKFKSYEELQEIIKKAFDTSKGGNRNRKVTVEDTNVDGVDLDDEIPDGDTIPWANQTSDDDNSDEDNDEDMEFFQSLADKD